MTGESRAVSGIMTAIGAMGIAPMASVVLLSWGGYWASRLGRRSLSRCLSCGGALVAIIALLASAPTPGAASLSALAQFALTHYVATGLLCLVAYVAGRRATTSMPYASRWEEFAFSTTLGLGMLALAVFVIGLLGWLYPQVLIATGLFVLLVCGQTTRDLWSERRGVRLSVSFSQMLVVVAVALIAAPILMLPLYPPIEFDATNYHLVYAKTYAVHHQIVYLPFHRTPIFPQMVEMLYTAMMVLLDDIGSQLVHFTTLLMVLGLTYSWGARLFCRRVGLWAALLCLASPLLLWEAGSAYVDLGLTLFTTAALYALSNWQFSSRPSWLVLSGAFAGFAAGTKYTGLTAVALAGMIVLCKSVAARNWRPPVLFALTAGLALSPFYIRNFYYTGNPFWPFLAPFLGYGSWSPEDYQQNISSIRNSRGMGTDPLALLELPWHLLLSWSEFGNRLPIITPLHFLLIPFALVGLFDWRIRFLFILAVIFTLAWFYSAQDSRYLLPLLPILNLLLFASFERVVSSLKSKWSQVGSPLMYTAVCLSVVVFGCSYALLEVRKDGYPPTDEEGRQAYLASHLRPYRAVRWLNVNVRDYRVYQLFVEDMNYFFQGEVVGDWFGPGRYGDIIEAAGSGGQQLYDRLKSLGVSHFLVSDRHKLKLPDDHIFADRFRAIYRGGGVAIYELPDDNVRDGRGSP